ncbi:MAG: PHP domain-containing protein [Candidatus Binatia bacterium]|nr:PHP domain-containing protein [Candidatus Binatia bacterium]
MARILDLHLHSEASDDSRAPVEAYLKWLARKRDERPIEGLVLTEHRQFNRAADYRALEDKYGILILKASEVETDYGHMLVYGVNDDILARFDFRNVRLNAQELINEVARMGGIAMPCHPGRPTIGLIEHYQKKPPLEGVVGVEALNGGSKKGEDERVAGLVQAYGYHAFGGSDSHLVSFVGLCATEFDRDIKNIEELVEALRTGGYRPVDFRPKKPQPSVTPEGLTYGAGL